MTLCFVYERPSVRNDIFLLCCDNVDRIFFELQCIHCYQTSVNLGVGGCFFLGGGGLNSPYSCFYLSPLFQLEKHQPNMQFAPPVSPAQLAVRRRGNVWRGPLTIAPFIQTLYAKWLPKQFLWILHCMDLLCSRVVADLRCLYSRDKSKGSFSLIVMNWRASVSVSVRMCVQFFLLFFFCSLFLHLKRGKLLLCVNQCIAYLWELD